MSSPSHFRDLCFGLALAGLASGFAACSREALPSPPALRARDAVANKPAAPYVVCLQPLGEHDATLLAPIARGIAQAYGFETRTLAPRPLPRTAWYPPRRRYRAQLLLDDLHANVLPHAPECNALVGITAADVSMTKGEVADWGVLGLSYRGDRVAVVSSFRLHGGVARHRVVERAVKVVIHELGHVIGLPHRDDGPDCVMNDARGSVQVIDRARGSLCAPERVVAEALLGRKLPQRDALDWPAIEK